MKKWNRKVLFRFLILFILMGAILLNLDLQKSPSLKVGFDLVESIGFDHRFLKLVALVQSYHHRVISILAEGCISFAHFSNFFLRICSPETFTVVCLWLVWFCGLWIQRSSNGISQFSGIQSSSTVQDFFIHGSYSSRRQE